MGLDISYYRDCKRLRDVPEDGEYDYDAETSVYVNPAFVAQADGLTDGIYSTGDGDGFRAGSYSGYNAWRQWLAGLCGTKAQEAFEGRYTGPMSELINFSDCEGLIGPVTSAKLAKDFAALADHVDRISAAGDWYGEQFRKWRTAFETAQHGGFVQFH